MVAANFTRDSSLSTTVTRLCLLVVQYTSLIVIRSLLLDLSLLVAFITTLPLPLTLDSGSILLHLVIRLLNAQHRLSLSLRLRSRRWRLWLTSLLDSLSRCCSLLATLLIASLLIGVALALLRLGGGGGGDSGGVRLAGVGDASFTCAIDLLLQVVPGGFGAVGVLEAADFGELDVVDLGEGVSKDGRGE